MKQSRPNENRKNITIGETRADYSVNYSLLRSATYIRYLLSDDKRDLKKLSEFLTLTKTLNKKDSVTEHTQQTKRHYEHKANLINKPLSLELLSTMLLNNIDSPETVHSHCRTRKASNQSSDTDEVKHVPHNYAPAGTPDIEIDYAAFKMMVEVSLHKKGDKEFKKQLISASSHALAIRKSGYDKPIYVLLVNNNSLTDSKIKDALNDAGKKYLEEDIHFLSLSLDEFTKMGKVLGGAEFKDSVSALSSEEFEKLLQKTVADAFQPKAIRLDERMIQYFTK